MADACSKPGDFDTIAWIKHQMKVSECELEIWRERFPLYRSLVRKEAEERASSTDKESLG